MESEAEMSSDASAQPSTNHVYRKYTEQNLLAAIKVSKSVVTTIYSVLRITVMITSGKSNSKS